MVTSQTQEDKERFFAELDRLGESADETLNSDHGELLSDDDDIKIVKVLAAKPRSLSVEDKEEKRGPSPSKTRAVHIEGPATTKTTDPHCSKPIKKVEVAKKRDQSTAIKTRVQRKTKSKNEIELLPDGQRLFDNCTFFFIPNDDVAKPRKTRIRTSISHGATWVRAFDSATTHVIVDPQLDINAASKALPENWSSYDAIFVRDTWLIDSLRYKHIQDHLQSRFWVRGFYDLVEQRKKAMPSQAVRKPSASRALKRKRADLANPEPEAAVANSSTELDIIMEQMKELEQYPSESDISDLPSFASSIPETDSERSHDGDQIEAAFNPKAKTGFQCMEKHDGNRSNPNAKTIEILQKMAKYYDQTGDHWRTTAYRKAIAALQKQTEYIATKEQAVAIPQIGGSLADKIEEIVSTNKLKKLESAEDDPQNVALRLFMGIYGVGLAQANPWIARGYRTLEDLTNNVHLTTNQKIGIEHYEDFQQRIPRAEVSQHGQIVQSALHEADPQLDAIIGGSYRRGNPDSSDIDILITKRDADMQAIRELMTEAVIPHLTEVGFLKVTLASSSSSSQGSKWHGASCLPGHTIWRRLDLLFVPWSEFGAALIYFTGNDIFNRSLRLLASKKGMRLNQHGLYTNVLRGKGRKRVNDGELLEGHSEKKIFDILGVPWRPPQHRKC